MTVMQQAPKMQVVHSSHGRFHHHDLARELAARGMLRAFFTGYPRWKLRDASLPLEFVRTFPWVEVPFMAALKFGVLRGRMEQYAARVLSESFDRHVARAIPDCDAYIGLSCASLHAGRVAQSRGAIYVCDRGSTHIRAQDALLREEYKRQGIAWRGIDRYVVDKECREYEQADLITVPSEFVRRTFVEYGVPESKLAKVPYGVELSRFEKVGEPCPDRFEVLFVGSASVRKGVADLLAAFAALRHPAKRLTFVGSVTDEIRNWLRGKHLDPAVRFVGHLPQAQLKEEFSRAHVMVLPSIEEGLALVQAQALACGCPVIASEHTGARDLFEDGKEGFIVPVRKPGAIAERLQQLADDPRLRQRMGEAAMLTVRENLGGWSTYGDRIVAALLAAQLKRDGQ